MNKKGKGVKQVAAKTIVGVKEMSSLFETTFSMTCYLSYKMMSSLGWYKGKGVKQVVVGTIEGVEDMGSLSETTFSMTSYLSSNTLFRVGWYLDSGASRHMAYDM